MQYIWEKLSIPEHIISAIINYISLLSSAFSFLFFPTFIYQFQPFKNTFTWHFTFLMFNVDDPPHRDCSEYEEILDEIGVTTV